MFPVMTRASRWNGYLFVTLLALTMIYSVPKLFSFASAENETVDLYMEGELARKFEGGFDREFPIRDMSVRLWADASYLLFREGQRGVILGDQQWLFTNEELVVPTNLASVLDEHMRDVIAIRDDLALMDKRLVVIPVPMKVDVYADYLLEPPDEQLMSLYPDFVERLRAAGIETVSLHEKFHQVRDTELLFLQRDTHWTPEGARLAARTVAEALPELKGQSTYATDQVETTTYSGDLLNFVRMSTWLAPKLREKDLINRYETVPATEQGADALFGERAPPLLLVGSSYTAIDAWNFVGFLQEALSREIVTVAVKAKGPIYAMRQYLQMPPSGVEKVDTVLWEFPVRELLRQDQRLAAWQATLNQMF